MSFYNNNKNFIIQYLKVEMKGLSLEDRHDKYKNFRSKVRDRMYKSYPKNSSNLDEVQTLDLCEYYKELLEFLGEYELEYILCNLIFESNFTNITYHLKKFSVHFNNLITPPFETYSFKNLIFLYLKEDDFFQSTFINFIKYFISEHTSIPVSHLEIQKKSSGSFVFEFTHSYPEWLINNLITEKSSSKATFIHLIIIKYFNIERNFIDHSDSGKFAISFLHYLARNYDNKVKQGASPKLYAFYEKLKVIINDLFIKKFIVKTPILDSSERLEYPKGYYVKKKEFLKKVEKAEILNKDFSDYSFGDLIKLYFNINSSVREKIVEEILYSLKSLKFPQQEDLEALNQFTGEQGFDDFNNLINSKLYLFEMIRPIGLNKKYRASL